MMKVTIKTTYCDNRTVEENFTGTKEALEEYMNCIQNESIDIASVEYTTGHMYN